MRSQLRFHVSNLKLSVARTPERKILPGFQVYPSQKQHWEAYSDNQTTTALDGLDGMGTRFQKEAAPVICVICKNGQTQPGTATITFERDGATVVIKGVPARVCKNCGQEYVEEDITGRLLRTAEEAARSGVQVDVRNYQAA